MPKDRNAARHGGIPSFFYRRDDESEIFMKEQYYSTDSASQRNRILERLQQGPMTTSDARSELDIFHPAARVQELREDGHNIVTHWETVNTGKAKHRVASYVLLAGGVDAV